MRLHAVGSTLLIEVQSFYVDNRACFRIGNEVSNWFYLKVGVSQGCVMPPWLFNLYMDEKERSARKNT